MHKSIWDGDKSGLGYLFREYSKSNQKKEHKLSFDGVIHKLMHSGTC